MKTDAFSSVLSPSLMIMGALAGAVFAIALTGAKVPLLSNLRISLAVFLILGMAMCASGIGRVAATNQWTHLLSVAGYALGASILVIAAATLLGTKLPLVANGKQAFSVIAVLTVAKVLTSVVHSMLPG
jgi:hypothetical protein